MLIIINRIAHHALQIYASSGECGFRPLLPRYLGTKANVIALHTKEKPIAGDLIPAEKSIECPEQDEHISPIFHRKPKEHAALVGSVEISFKNHAHRILNERS